MGEPSHYFLPNEIRVDAGNFVTWETCCHFDLTGCHSDRRTHLTESDSYAFWESVGAEAILVCKRKIELGPLRNQPA